MIVSSDNSQSLDSKASKPAKNVLENAFKNQIIELMKQRPLITQVEIAGQIGHLRSKVQNVIKKLLENGRIERTGGRRYGKWSVKA